MRSVMAVLVCVVAMGCGGNVDPMCEPCDEPGDAVAFQLPDGCYPYCEAEDNDSDGIPDLEDDCPLQAETVNGYQDGDGCPDATPTPKTLGTWTGQATVSMDGSTFVYNETIIVTQNSTPGRVDIAESCPSAGPMISTTTTHDLATWTGWVTCPNVSLPWCDVLSMSHEIVSISVGDDGIGRFHINGHAAGCGRSNVAYAIEMSATKS